MISDLRIENYHYINRLRSLQQALGQVLAQNPSTNISEWVSSFFRNFKVKVPKKFLDELVSGIRLKESRLLFTGGETFIVTALREDITNSERML
jgi:hypothetical protein